MTFSQTELNKIGNIVANHEKLPAKTVVGYYEVHLREALSQTPTLSRHANVLRRMYGHFYKKLPHYKRVVIERHISEYQKGHVTLSQTLETLRNMTVNIDNMYLAKQSYFLLFSDKKSVWNIF